MHALRSFYVKYASNLYLSFKRVASIRRTASAQDLQCPGPGFHVEEIIFRNQAAVPIDLNAFSLGGSCDCNCFGSVVNNDFQFGIGKMIVLGRYEQHRSVLTAPH